MRSPGPLPSLLHALHRDGIGVLDRPVILLLRAFFPAHVRRPGPCDAQDQMFAQDADVAHEHEDHDLNGGDADDVACELGVLRMRVEERVRCMTVNIED